jgi:ferritin-like metal-binding protein YciE
LASAYHGPVTDLFDARGLPDLPFRAIIESHRQIGNDKSGMKITTLHDALVHELQDLYSAEVQLTKALPKMAKAASHEQLAEAFEEHLEQTKGHVERLEKALKQLHASTRGEKCKAMEGLIEEGKGTLELDTDDAVRDALIISIAQKVEHYEIAGYGTARTFAQRLGEDTVAALLEDTLEEESEADRKLTGLAESTVNPDAEVAVND